MAFSRCPHLEEGSRGLLIRTLIPSWGLHSHDLITSQGPHLLTPSHWGLGFNIGIWVGGDTSIQCIALFLLSPQHRHVDWPPRVGSVCCGHPSPCPPMEPGEHRYRESSPGNAHRAARRQRLAVLGQLKKSDPRETFNSPEKSMGRTRLVLMRHLSWVIQHCEPAERLHSKSQRGRGWRLPLTSLLLFLCPKKAVFSALHLLPPTYQIFYDSICLDNNWNHENR